MSLPIAATGPDLSGFWPDEDELQDFFEHAPVGLHWVGLDGRILWANRAALDLLGYSAEEYVGRPIADFHADPEVTDDIFRGLARGETLRDYEAALRHKDGSLRHVLISANGRWEAGVFVYARWFTVDITERKLAERLQGEALRLLVRASEVLVSSLDYQSTLQQLARLLVPTLADWCIVDLASEGQPAEHVALAHADPAKARLARRFQRRYPPSPNPEYGVAKVLATGQSEFYAEIGDALLAAVARDPEELALLRSIGLKAAMVVPLTARGQVLGAMTFLSAESGRGYSVQDLGLAEELARRAALAVDHALLYTRLQEQLDVHIQLNTALREAAEARDRALAELQQLMRARDEFLSSAAHDLRSPLAVVKSQAQLLHRRLVRGEAIEGERLIQSLDSIDHSATRMTGLINELLDTARIQLGQPLELNRRPVDLVAIAQRVAAEHQRATDRHGIQVRAELPELSGEWDAERLERVLSNLVDNAVKYSPRGGEVTLVLGAEEGAEGDWAVIEVRDQGLGIPSADLPYVFERFHRGKNVEGRIGGTGIGLAGARSIVESHGGTISVESEEGRGTVFWVRLPRATKLASAADSDR